MTAEIALLNRRALAFAADSAATISDGRFEKIYNSAEKIFEISWRSPIGLMLYNSLDFSGVPLDVLARSFRASNDYVFKNCRSACDTFIDYLCKFKRTKEDECEYLSGMLASEMAEIKSDYAKRRDENMRKAFKENANPDDIRSIPIKSLLDVFEEHKASHDEHVMDDYLSSVTVDAFEARYGDTVLNVVKRVIKSHSSEKLVIDAALNWALAAVRSSIFSDMLTGLVFGGFGTDDIFPSLYAVEIDGIFFDQLKKRVSRTVDIDRRGERAAIVPFAQSEMVERFLYGIDDDREADILNFVEKSFGRMCSRLLADNNIDLGALGLNGDIYAASVEKVLARLKERSRRETLDMVDFMPKQELSYTAEAFVTLTSMKRKVSAQQETVGGPIDVAVITKNEGFVWIKRKHYFDKELNPGYGVRARRQREGGEQDEGSKSKDRPDGGETKEPAPER